VLCLFYLFYKKLEPRNFFSPLPYCLAKRTTGLFFKNGPMEDGGPTPTKANPTISNENAGKVLEQRGYQKYWGVSNFYPLKNSRPFKDF